jgi:hypothetical protein
VDASLGLPDTPKMFNTRVELLSMFAPQFQLTWAVFTVYQAHGLRLKNMEMGAKKGLLHTA